jgi:hypothetical protein
MRLEFSIFVVLMAVQMLTLRSLVRRLILAGPQRKAVKQSPLTQIGRTGQGK